MKIYFCEECLKFFAQFFSYGFINFKIDWGVLEIEAFQLRNPKICNK